MLILQHIEAETLPEPAKTSYRRDEPNKAACLLCSLVVTPYFTWLPTPMLLAGWAIFYFLLIFPSFLSKSTWTAFIDAGREVLHHILAGVWEGLSDVRRHAVRFENALMKMHNMTTMVNQLLVLVACDAFFLPGQRFSCLYTLMFFNVTSYCVKYVSEMLQKDLVMQVNVSRQSGVRHLALTTTRIIYEWTKAVTFVITVVSMLLVFGLQRGLSRYQPTLPYLAVTAFYYAASERRLLAAWQATLERLRLHSLEGLEDSWTPVLLGYGCATCAGLLTLLVAQLGQLRLALALGYLGCWLRWRETQVRHVAQLREEMEQLAPFRRGDPQELRDCEDVCAVCLMPMTSARVTPCHHLFHGGCLRRCLQVSDRCAICKRPFHFD